MGSPINRQPLTNGAHKPERAQVDGGPGAAALPPRLAARNTAPGSEVVHAKNAARNARRRARRAEARRLERLLKLALAAGNGAGQRVAVEAAEASEAESESGEASEAGSESDRVESEAGDAEDVAMEADDVAAEAAGTASGADENEDGEDDVDNDKGDVGYPVHSIVNRRSVAGSYQYRVVRWSRRRRLERSWEPQADLEDQGFHEQLAAVDEWLEGGARPPFWEWAATNRPAVISASPAGQCMFEAFGLALHLPGDPVEASDSAVSEYIRATLGRGIDIRAGIQWKLFVGFVRRVVALGSRVDQQRLGINLHATGHRGVEAIKRLDLEGGVYLVGAFNTLRVGHAFVMSAAAGQLTAMDSDSVERLEEYGRRWIERVAFVRKVQLTTN